MTHRFWKVHGALIETGATFTLRGDFEQLGGEFNLPPSSERTRRHAKP
ncbi:MAG: hypothetical protein K0S79_266 [Nitrospira sp.]|nr:hypothetical protein [Nitrospira sp.]